MHSKLYRDFLKSNNFIFSYTSLNHSLLKKEKQYQIELYTYNDAFKAIYDYIEGFYNPISINFLSSYKFCLNY